MSRWQQFCEFDWSKDKANDEFLQCNGKDTSWVLPLDFVLAKSESPNCILFKQYAYFRSDMEIRFVVNSNKFHAGSLQASFYYGATADKYYGDRANIFSASQISHCIIDAATASDATLHIPYRYYKPLMATSARDDDKVHLDIGTLRLKVLNQLMTPTNDNNVINVSMFIRFVNPSFHGMKPRELGVVGPEMNAMVDIVNTTARLVNQFNPDPCRDNPTDIIPPKPIVPWNAHSWSIGDVCPEPSNPMRLQATGNTPHPPGTLPIEPEMDIKYLTSIFGLIKQVKWSNSSTPGTVLYKIPFSPILDVYPTKTLKNPDEVTCDIMPPVSVMASLFAYWRGSLEYKLDFIATQFHTGRLIIAYVPRVLLTTDPTIEQLTYCDHVVVDLRDTKQFSYINGFLSDKPWWPRRSHSQTSTEIYPPGYIYISVLNRLTATASVSSSIEFNVYMRGGPDFEIHIPVSPNIGLSFNTSYPKTNTNLITYIDSYGPPNTTIYVGSWHSLGGTYLVCRYGPTSDHVTQFPLTVDCSKVYGLEDSKIKIKSKSRTCVYFVCYRMSGYCYMSPVETYAVGASFCSAIASTNYELNDTAKGYILQDGDSPSYTTNASVIYWKPVTGVRDDDFVVVSNMAGDERKDECGEKVQVQRFLMSTEQGMYTFGEKIYSVKQLVRRYAPYGQYISSSKKNPSNPQLADFAFPVLPQGLDLLLKDDKDNWLPYGSKVRDGPIAILASGYRFFRGSVRYRIVFDMLADGAIWINHRPEYKLLSTSILKPNDRLQESIFQPGYASLVQFSNMNNVVEFEIPFYLPGQFGMLQRPDLSKSEDAVHYSLGMVYVGLDCVKGVPAETPYICEIFYSMGDDMSFTTFQGFPPMFNLDIFKVPTSLNNPRAEMMSSIKGKIGKYIVQAAAETISETIESAGQDEIKVENSGQVKKEVVNLEGEESIMSLVRSYLDGIDEAK
nr:MAG: hypothetical protein [Iflaviridae sp.]